jgi:glyoxylase-like metal-dependent hydrolase (beta-lactamase superfamily II)
MQIRAFYDPATYTLSYVVFDQASRDAVVIDPVLDFDQLRSRTSTDSVERIAAFLDEHRLRVHYVLETHAHADHLSGSQYLKRRYEAKIGIGARITEVQQTFRGIFDLSVDVPTDGSQFDLLLEDGQHLRAGTVEIEVIATPGHTPACVSYKIGDALFTGDALFLEDYGTGRCDFPKGSAEALYSSVHDKLYRLPDETRVFVGHDYQPGGRQVRWETTIGRSKAENVQLKESTTLEDFVAFRSQRDASLAPPVLLYPSVQVNVDAGRLPRPHGNGTRYLVLPLNMGRPTADDGSR